MIAKRIGLGRCLHGRKRRNQSGERIRKFNISVISLPTTKDVFSVNNSDKKDKISDKKLRKDNSARRRKEQYQWTE